MRHPRQSPPPPIPTENVSGDELLVDTVAWLTLWVSFVLVSLCLYQRTRSELHMELHLPDRPHRIRFSLFRSPHVSLVY